MRDAITKQARQPHLVYPTFHPAAEAEHLNNIRHYESFQAGLGARYLDQFESALRAACTNPKMYAAEQLPSIRRIRVKGFPFTIFFREQSGEIQVLAVAHHRRRPDYWLTRPTEKTNKESQ